MKKAINDTRIRITVDMPVAGETTLTMTACAWNAMCNSFGACAREWEKCGCPTTAKDFQEVADRIYYVLQGRGYYDD